jgi:hypothetical protein
VAAATRPKRSKGRIVVLERWFLKSTANYTTEFQSGTHRIFYRGAGVYSAGAGARKILSLIFAKIRS